MVALARALAVKPEILLLDEPLSSLDSPARPRVMELLRGIGTRLDIPVIHVTHDFDEAASLADRLAILNDGELQAYGEVAQLLQDTNRVELRASGLQLDPALRAAFAEDGPTLIDVTIDASGYGAQLAALRG